MSTCRVAVTWTEAPWLTPSAKSQIVEALRAAGAVEVHPSPIPPNGNEPRDAPSLLYTKIDGGKHKKTVVLTLAARALATVLKASNPVLIEWFKVQEDASLTVTDGNGNKVEIRGQHDCDKYFDQHLP